MSFFLSNILLMSMLILTSSCGDKAIDEIPEGYTRVYFSMPNKAVLNGGVMVYIQNQEIPQILGSAYLSTEYGPAPSNVILKNGPYKFTALGYTLASPQLNQSTQSFYCGFAQNAGTVLLSGGVQAVQIDMAQDNTAGFCSNPIFSTPTYVSGPQIKYVNKVWACSSATPSTPVTTSCSNAGGASASIGSLKVHLLEYSHDGPPNDPFSHFQIIKNKVVSDCITVNSGEGPILYTFPLPVGNGPLSPYPVLVETFSGASCGTAYNEYLFPHGIGGGGGAPNGNIALSYVNGANVELYFQD